MSGSGESLAPFRSEEDPQAYVLTSSLGYVWDVGTLEWVKSTATGGGGAVTIADGADVTQGAKADVAWVSGDGTVISLLKKIASSGGGAVTIANGADVAEGATTDAAVVTDAAGTVSGKLRGLVKWAFERMPTSLGQKAMAASLPVVVSSDQSAVPVSGTFWQATQPVSGTVTASGPLTDAELRSTPVPVSGTVTANAGSGTFVVSAASLPLPTGAATSALQTQPGVDIGDVTVNNSAGVSAVNIQDGGNSITVDAASLPLPTGAATETTLGTRLADATFTGRINTQGQKTMAASTPVVVASDQSAIPVSAASLPLPTGAATAALQTQPGVDIGDVTVNNAAGASAVNIQDGGNSITVDGTVGVSGSVAVTGPLTDAQLRASAVPVSMGVTDLAPAAPTAASVGVTSASAVAANGSRKGLVLINTSNARISLGLGAAAVLDSGITLYPSGVFSMDAYSFDTGQVNAIASAAASNLAIQEYS